MQRRHDETIAAAINAITAAIGILYYMRLALIAISDDKRRKR